MKNIIFFILLIAFSVQAKDSNSAPEPIEITAITTDEFKKVDSSELTPPVVEEILKQYPTSKLAGVYKNNKGQFKLIMVLQSGTRRTVYIDQYGNWFKKKR